MRPQWPDNILCEVWLVRVPNKADGNDLRGVHEDPSDPNPLPTFTLKKKKKKKRKSKKCSKKQAFNDDTVFHGKVSTDLPDNSEGPLWYSLLVKAPQMTRACDEASVD